MKVGDIVCASRNFDPDQRLGLVLEIIDEDGHWFPRVFILYQNNEIGWAYIQDLVVIEAIA